VQSDTFDSNSAALSTSPSSDPNTLRSLLFVQAVSASSYLPLAGSDDTFKVYSLIFIFEYMNSFFFR